MNITILFTYGISLEEWDRKGLIDRELLIYHRLIENGYNVSFITYGGIEDLKYKKRTGDIKIFPVYERLAKSKFAIINILKSFIIPVKFKEIFKNADIIKTNQMQGSWVGIIAKFLYGKKLIIRCGFEWYRNAYIRRRKNFSFLKNSIAWFLEKVIYKYCDKIIISNQSDVDFVKKNFRINERKIHLVRNFVDIERFRPLDSQKKENRILYVGRLESRKNIVSIIKAIEHTPYSLDIVGRGEQEGELKEVAIKSGLDVGFMGIIPNQELPILISEYPVAILASHYENSPKFLLEAMSCGIAVLGTDVPGIKEIIMHRENGFLCNKDQLSIRKAIETVMRDDALRKYMGNNAREYILKNCSLGKILREESEIYNKALKNGKASLGNCDIGDL